MGRVTVEQVGLVRAPGTHVCSGRQNPHALSPQPLSACPQCNWPFESRWHCPHAPVFPALAHGRPLRLVEHCSLPFSSDCPGRHHHSNGTHLQWHWDVINRSVWSTKLRPNFRKACHRQGILNGIC